MSIKPRTVLFFLLLLGSLYLLVKFFSVYWLIIMFNIMLIYINCVFLFAYLERSDGPGSQVRKWPSLSVIIPNYNGEKTLKQCIDAVKAMEYPLEKEIIVIDDGSRDSSREILSRIKGIRVIAKKKNEGKASGLNDGIRAAKGEIIAAIDSDTFPAKDALVKMVARFDSEEVGAVTGLVRSYRPQKFVEKIQEIEYLISFGFFQSVLADINGIMVTPGPMSLFRKKVLEEIGYFDETNITEDMEIAMRLQSRHYRIASEPRALIYTVVPDNFSHWYRQRTRWYRGKFVNTRKYAGMVFNPKFGEFGMFSFPFSLFADALAILLIAVTIAANMENLFNYSGFLVSWVGLGGGIWGAIPSGFSLHSSIYFYFFTIILYSFLVYVSHGFVNDRLSLWKLPEIVFYMFIYGFFISFVYFTSFFKEINSSDYAW